MANQQIDNIEDINEAINPITPPIDGQEGLEILGHNRNQPVILSRFSRSFFKIYSHLISLYSSIKNLGQNKLDKGNYTQTAQDLKNDIDERVPYYSSTKIVGIHYNPNVGLHWYPNVSTAYKFWDSNNFNPDEKLDRGGLTGTALELKNWLVSNYTTLMNNIKATLDNDIATKLPHGGYNKTAQDLKNEVDTKVSNTKADIKDSLSVPLLEVGQIELKSRYAFIDFGIDNDTDFETRIIRNQNDNGLDIFTRALNFDTSNGKSVNVGSLTGKPAMYIDTNVVGFLNKTTGKHGVYHNTLENIVVGDLPWHTPELNVSTKVRMNGDIQLGSTEIVSTGNSYIDITELSQFNSGKDFGIRFMHTSNGVKQLLTDDGTLTSNLSRLNLGSGGALLGDGNIVFESNDPFIKSKSLIPHLSSLSTRIGSFENNILNHALSVKPATQYFKFDGSKGQYLAVLQISGRTTNASNFTYATLTVPFNTLRPSDFTLDRVIEAGVTVHPLSINVSGTRSSFDIFCPTGVLIDLKIDNINMFKIQ